ncbi:MAG: hypothetical protein WCC04_07040 [Terriglobales bacterium]
MAGRAVAGSPMALTPVALARVPPQPLLATQSFVERYGLQLVHHPRARLHHVVPMP